MSDASVDRAASIIESKLEVAPAHVSLVERPAVIERLVDAPWGSVTLVSAGAGYGKTGLLANAVSRIAGPVAWLSLESRDDEFGLFWSQLLASLSKACPVVAGQQGHAVLDAFDTDHFVPELLNCLAGCPEQITIVLDDVHYLGPDLVTGPLTDFIERLPISCRLFMSSRVEPDLPIARWRTEGRMLEVQTSDLALTMEQALEFVTERLSLPVTPEAVAEVWRATEGWPAAIYLTVLALPTDEDISGFVNEAIEVEQAVVGDYLIFEVLSRLDQETQRVLRQLSVLERVTGSLADAVLQRTGSDLLLQQLSKDNMFIAPMDAAGKWFRFHSIFRSLLRRRLEAKELALVPDLVARATQWYLDRGEIGSAVEVTASAGTPDLTAQILNERYAELTGRGEIDQLGLAQGIVADADQAPSAALVASAGWVAVRAGDYEKADELVARGRLSWTDKQSTGLFDLVAASRLWRSGSVGDGFALAFEVYSNPELIESTRTLAQWIAGQSAVLNGDFSLGSQLLRGTMAKFPDNYGTGQCLPRASLALALFESDAIDEAKQTAEEGLRRARMAALDETMNAAMLLTVLGLVEHRRGHGRPALEYLERGESLSEGLPYVEAAYIKLALAGVLRRGTDVTRARDLVNEARELLDRCSDPGPVVLGVWERNSRSLKIHRYRGSTMVDQLTGREMELLRLLTTDLKRGEIANALGVSTNTVKSHTAAVYRKLGVSSREAAVDTARREGLL